MIENFKKRLIKLTIKLSSYRLDSVASHFIRGEINKIELISKDLYKLYCNSVDDIFKQDFIHIEFITGYVSDYIGKKYIVEKIF